MRLTPSPPIARRSFLGGAALAVAAPMLAVGCAGSEDTGDASSPDWRAMTWEGKDEMKKWNLHIHNFFADRPDLKPSVDFGIAWEEYWTKLQTSVAAGTSPDLCWMHDTRVALFASQGMLEPLDDKLSADVPPGWPDKFFQSQVDGFKYQGKQYGFPYDWASAGLFVNLDWLADAGVSVPDENTSYEEFLQLAIKLTEHAGKPGQQWGMSLPLDSNFGYAVVRAFGGEYVGQDGSIHFTDPETISAFQYLYDAIWKHQAMPNTSMIKAATAGSGDTAALFSSGKVAMLHSLNDTSFVMEDLIKGDFKWTIAPLPRGSAGHFQGVGGSAFSIPKGSPHPDLTYEFIKYALSDPKNLPVTAKMGSMFVANTDFWKEGIPAADIVDPDHYAHTFFELGRTDGVRPFYFPAYGRWDSSVYVKNTDALWTNTTSDVGQVMDRLQTETQPLLQQN